MYHRVINKDMSIQAGMYVTPQNFRRHLEVIKNNFTAAPLDCLINNEGFATQQESNKPLCILTFDDGWKDFYDNAYPLLKEYNIPATVFLPTDFIGSQKQFWTDLFTYLLINRNSRESSETTNSQFSLIIEQIEKFSGSFEQKLENGIEFLKNYPKETIDTALAVLAKKWQVDLNMSSRTFLSWEEVGEMYSTGLVSFGSHTVHHPILTTMQNIDELRKELTESYACLLERGVVSKSNICFCYPNGKYSDEIAHLVRETGYRLAVTTKTGHNQAYNNRFTLNRIGIHQDISSTPSLFHCLITGLL